MHKKQLLVIGSINFDFFTVQDQLPRRGETMAANSLTSGYGGKGANQAVQAARLGCSVQMVGAISADDEFGSRCAHNLRDQGVTPLLRESSQRTGVGLVQVTGNGEVSSTIYEGANGCVDSGWVRHHGTAIAEAGLLVLQNEIPATANATAIAIAQESRTPVVYNAAPARPVDVATLNACTWLVVNESEAEYYLGRPLGQTSNRESMRSAVERLRSLCPGVILTLGRDGCYVAWDTDIRFIPAVAVRTVDSTGAGDSFIGAFCSALLQGSAPEKAAEFASDVASKTVTGMGAQASMPNREAIQNEAVPAAGTHP